MRLVADGRTTTQHRASLMNWPHRSGAAGLPLELVPIRTRTRDVPPTLPLLLPFASTLSFSSPCLAAPAVSVLLLIRTPRQPLLPRDSACCVNITATTVYRTRKCTPKLLTTRYLHKHEPRNALLAGGGLGTKHHVYQLYLETSQSSSIVLSCLVLSLGVCHPLHLLQALTWTSITPAASRW